MHRAEEGERVRISLTSRSVHISDEAIDLSGNLGLARLSTEEALATIEEAFDVYRRSLSSVVEHGEGHRWFHAAPCAESDILWGEDRVLARLRLELTVLFLILNGSLDPQSALFRGKWFWQSPRQPELIILTEWLQASKY